MIGFIRHVLLFGSLQMFGPHGEANGVWRDDAHLIEDTLRTEEGINPNPNVTSEWASSLIGADWGVALVAKRRDASGCSQVQDGVPKWQTWERTTAPVKASHDVSFHVTSVASDAMDARCYHLDHKLRTIRSPARMATRVGKVLTTGGRTAVHPRRCHYWDWDTGNVLSPQEIRSDRTRRPFCLHRMNTGQRAHPGGSVRRVMCDPSVFIT